MRRRACAVATVLSVAITLVWGNPSAAAQEAVPDGAIEARVGARWLPDGRVEVTLQVRSDSGAWGEPLLPRNRLMPAESKHPRWLSTSPVALQDAEARVVARRLTNGLVKVALRVRALDGGWSERLLPVHGLLLYASSESGVRTWSSPVTLAPQRAQVVAFYGHPGVPAMGVLGHGTPAKVAEEIGGWAERYGRGTSAARWRAAHNLHSHRSWPQRRSTPHAHTSHPGTSP